MKEKCYMVKVKHVSSVIPCEFVTQIFVNKTSANIYAKEMTDKHKPYIFYVVEGSI